MNDCIEHNNNYCELYNEDCLVALKKIPDESVDMIITDPPYGVDYQSNWNVKNKATKVFDKIKNDKKPFIWFLYDAFRVVKDGGAILCFTREDVLETFKVALEVAGFKVKNVVIWDKEIHGMGDLKGSFAPRYEMIIFAVKGRYIFPNKRPQNIIKVQRVNPKDLTHPNEKPVELLTQLIEYTTRENETILDCFMGSGSCGEAVMRTGRNFVGMELDKEYYNLSVKRLESIMREKTSAPKATTVIIDKEETAMPF